MKSASRLISLNLVNVRPTNDCGSRASVCSRAPHQRAGRKYLKKKKKKKSRVNTGYDLKWYVYIFYNLCFLDR